jgi:hypothetical protein
MRVEIVEDYEGQGSTLAFPPGEDYLDLRENPRSIERITVARQYLPLRNFLSIINSGESPFATASATAKCDSPAATSSGMTYEFASQTNLVFAEPSLNFNRQRFTDLCSSLKELLERDLANTVRAHLRISPCDFSAENRNGFCLVIRLVAEGDTSEQAELRWGLGLARVQQALLFRARALKQQN